MKKINISLVAVAVFGLLGFYSPVSAEIGIDVSTKTTVNGNIRSQNRFASSSGDITIQGNATSSTRNNSQKGTSSNMSTHTRATTTTTRATSTSEVHKSTVALFVQNLLDVADRNQGIGAKVRVIAMAQNNAQATTTALIQNIEARGSFKTFFIGSDYKNLAMLQKEMIKTKEQIQELKSLMLQTTNEVDKIEISVQIKALENDQIKIQAFIDAYKNKFSLFGWLMQKFNLE